MHETAAEVAELMKVLANPKRLLILCQLVEGERSVGELARLLDMREQAMSQQLALLRKDGLVTTRREGQTIHYALARGDIARLLDFLYRTYCAPLEDGQGPHGETER
jgi:ArsR family transcriptional regulator, virulence genes transcriptional regulator